MLVRHAPQHNAQLVTWRRPGGWRGRYRTSLVGCLNGGRCCDGFGGDPLHRAGKPPARNKMPHLFLTVFLFGGVTSAPPGTAVFCTHGTWRGHTWPAPWQRFLNNSFAGRRAPRSQGTAGVWSPVLHPQTRCTGLIFYWVAGRDPHGRARQTRTENLGCT